MCADLHEPSLLADTIRTGISFTYPYDNHRASNVIRNATYIIKIILPPVRFPDPDPLPLSQPEGPEAVHRLGHAHTVVICSSCNM